MYCNLAGEEKKRPAGGAHVPCGHAPARATTQGYIGAQRTRSKCPCCSTDRFGTWAPPACSPLPYSVAEEMKKTAGQAVSFGNITGRMRGVMRQLRNRMQKNLKSATMR